MEHAELIQEMVLLEKLTAQERLKHAKRRRQQQLNNWNKRDAIFDNQTRPISANKSISSNRRKPYLVQFPDNIVLLEATARQDIDEVRNLLQSGKYSPNVANEDGLTPIHQCSIDNTENILQILIEYKGNVNAKDRDLWTPLHAAATCGHLEICRILIENGAELLALNADGNMPYDICDDDRTLDYIETQMDHNGITQQMIDETRAQTENRMLADLRDLAKKSLSSSRSIDDILSYRNSEGATPLHIASANGYQLVVEYLLQQHVSINLQDVDGWTPLHAAAFWCQQPILAQLIEAGGDIYEKLSDGRSALDLCEDPDLRTFMTEFREKCRRDQQKAAAVAAAAAAAAAAKATQLQQKPHLLSRPPAVHSLPNGVTPRTGTLYESRSSVSSPYGSGSSLNRTSSVRRPSLRDREKVKKLQDNFVDVLQAKDKIQEDTDDNPLNNTSVAKVKTNDERDGSTTTTTTTDSTVREPVSTTITTTSVRKPIEPPVIQVTLPPLKVPPTLPPPQTQTTADTLIDIKRRREERRRGIGGLIQPTNLPSSETKTSPPMPLNGINQKTNTKISNDNHLSTTNNSMPDHSAERFIEIHGHVNDDTREKKRICCTIL